MLKALSRKPPPLVGLDLNVSAATLVGLERAGRGHRVNAFASVPMPAGAMADQGIASVELVGQAVAEAVRRAGTRVRHAALAVPGSQVITRRILMPQGLEERDFELQVGLDADQHIPFPLEEVYLDFQVLGPSPKSVGSVDVLLAAARTDVVDQRVAGVEAGGLHASVMDVEAYALEGAYGLVAGRLPADLRQGVVALVDIGPEVTTLCVLRNREAVFTREQIFGTNHLTLQVEQRYGIDRDQALEAQRQGTLDADFTTELLAPFRETVASQVGRLLQAYYATGGQAQVAAVLLSGAGANLPDIVAAVEREVGLQTLRTDPVGSLELAPGLPRERLRADSPAFMIALGLALRTFDDAAR
jgi:type IV pilus assembly protein PilM